MEFLERVDLHSVNKKAIEVLIQTGSFDCLGVFRSTLSANLERAVEYAAHKKEATRFGQVSLFEDSGVQEFADFKFDELEDWPQMEKLRIEKELIGFYISGHPLDAYRKAFDRASTFDVRFPERAQKDKSYTIVGMIKSVRPYQTKSGKWMGFGAFEDFNGSIDLTFFPNIWEKVRDRAVADSVWGFAGKIDTSRDTPSFLVDSLVNPDELQAKSIREVHIKIAQEEASETHLSPLRDFLFESSGSCSVYFHLDTPGKPYVVKAANQIQVPANDDFMERVIDMPGVVQAWKE